MNADRYGRTADSGLLELNIQVLRQGDEAVLRICDKGVGVEPEEMARIVRPFERGDTARGGTKGAGLGLAIVVRVVKRSGGRIKLSSNHPHGLIVELMMPLANKTKRKTCARRAKRHLPILFCLPKATFKTFLIREPQVKRSHELRSLLFSQLSHTLLWS